jgi:RimJ/RimL family protein N-acetyltransferase
MPITPEINYKIREATEEDIPIILDLCYQLSVYEKLEFKGTIDLFKKYGFSEDKIFGCLLVENLGKDNSKYLGMALYYFTFSTFESRPTLWLEDLFVPDEYRNKGIGKDLLKRLSRIAIERDCGRIEWTVLDWNKPSRDFFFKLGSKALDGWTIFRLTREFFEKLAE